MRKALVTGATGGLGLALARHLLADGYEVRATGRNRQAVDRLGQMGAEIVVADLVREPEAARTLCQGVDVVFHCAALSQPWGRAEDFIAMNIDVTRRLLEAARAGGCGGLVLVSSPSVYAGLRDRIGLTEADPPVARPLNAYARTKLIAEQFVLTANDSGFFTVAIRPRALVGPDDTVVLPRLMAMLARGRAPLPRGGRALVELTDTRDAARALVLADRQRSRIGGQVFNVSGGRPVAIRDMAIQLARARGRSLELLNVPWPILFAGAAGLECLAVLKPGRPEPLLTRYSVATLAFSQTFDLEGARRGLGYRPRHDANATILELARQWPEAGR